YLSHPFENLVQGARIKIGPSHICSRRSVCEDQSFPVVEPDSLSQNVTCIPRISRPCDLQRGRHCTKDSFSLAVNERGGKGGSVKIDPASEHAEDAGGLE